MPEVRESVAEVFRRLAGEVEGGVLRFERAADHRLDDGGEAVDAAVDGVGVR